MSNEVITFVYEGEPNVAIEEALRRAIMRWVPGVFDLTQLKVPRRTGNLANSGSVETAGTDGLPSIVYTEHYAEYVERGIEGRFEGAYYILESIDELTEEFGNLLSEELGGEFIVTEG